MSDKATQYSEARSISLAEIELLELAASADVIITRGDPVLSIEAADADAAAAIVCRRIDRTLRVEGGRTVFSVNDSHNSTNLSAKGWRRVAGAWIKGDGVIVHDGPHGRTIHVLGDKSTVVMGDIIGTSIVHQRAVVRLTLPSAPKIHATGAGDIDLVDVDQDLLDATIAGSGDFRVAGHVRCFTLRLTGSGDVKAKRLVARDVVVDMTGSGDASFHASHSICGKIIGGGDVTVRGGPEHRELRAIGSGDVRYRGIAD